MSSKNIAGKYEDMLSVERINTLKTVNKITDYAELNIYTMDIQYDYDLDRLIDATKSDTQDFMMAVFNESVPGIKIDYTAPNFGCSAFTMKRSDGGVSFGRNYDFKFDSSAMIVRCHPKNSYASIATAALDKVYANDPFSTDESMLACLTSPFICLDGINEKGVGVCVLTLDSEPVKHNTGKPVLATTIVMRLVLDKASTTQEAIDLLSNYDMYAISGRDYHFYITDESGDGRVIEFDCDTPERKMVVTPTNAVTNFFICHKDRVLPNQKNGVYGHGRERYDVIKKVLDKADDNANSETAWKALIGAAQEPNPDNITSNTQWSIEYDVTNRKSIFSLHRKWDDKYIFKL